MFFWEHVVCKLPPPPSCIRCLCYKRRLFSDLPNPTASLVAFRLPATDKHERPDAASGHHYSGFSKMSSKKPFPNGEAAPEGSVGRHGNRWTNGIFMALSGLAAVVSFVALLFMVRELASIRDQQMAIMTDLQGLKDQVLQMQLKQEKEAEDKTASMTIGPDGPPGDVRSTEDHSATFWKSAEMHRRSKRDTLDNAIPLQNRLKEVLRGYGYECGSPTAPPADTDCAAYKAAGHTTSGVYTLGSPLSGVEVYCDMDTAGDGCFPTEGGWTVIQRRMDGSVPFNKNWEEYKHGFGNKNGEYWLGNENIHLLTAQKDYRLRVELMDWESQTRYAEYDTFRVAGESDGYRLTVSGYVGTAGDGMVGSYTLNGQKFSTVDRDNDANSSGHCSQLWGQGGWWFRACGYSFLNGRYLRDCARGDTCPVYQGVVWSGWRSPYYSLKSVSMKIRPR